MRFPSVIRVILVIGLCACSGIQQEAALDSLALARNDSIARAVQDSINRAQPGYIVDSILPAEEALRRFREGMSDPKGFSNGIHSRDELVERWVKAIEQRDSVALLQLVVNRAEFAWIVYPVSPNAAPPFYHPPGFAWELLQGPSMQGYRRTLDRLGGSSLGFVGFECPEEVSRFGQLSVWQDCVVKRNGAPGETAAQRLFGPIVEYAGRFKLLSLASDF